MCAKTQVDVILISSDVKMMMVFNGSQRIYFYKFRKFSRSNIYSRFSNYIFYLQRFFFKLNNNFEKNEIRGS